MNKLLVGKEKGPQILSFHNCSSETTIVVPANETRRLIIIGEDTNKNLIFNVQENGQLIVFHATKNSNDHITISLQGEKALANYIHHTLSTKENSQKIDIIHEAPYTKCLLENFGFHRGSEALKFIVNTKIPNTSIGCTSSQNNKIITKENNKSLIAPNMFIDTNDVEAMHSAYIGPFKEDILFYLQSRGIDKDHSEQLLIKGLLLGGFSFEGEEEQSVYNLFF